MPIYNYKRPVGQSGYSGINPITYGGEVLAQTNFNPYDKWSNDSYGDISFDNGVVISLGIEGYAGLDQLSENFATAVVADSLYEVRITISNYQEGDFNCWIYLVGPETPINLSNGLNIFEIDTTGYTNDYFDLYIQGTTGGFKITNISMKLKTTAPRGYSGYSGESIDKTPSSHPYLEPMIEGKEVQTFNKLLGILRNAGWMKTE